MSAKKSICFRLEADIIRALRTRAVENDRSANAECTRILRSALITKKALEADQSNSNAFQQSVTETNQ